MRRWVAIGAALVVVLSVVVVLVTRGGTQPVAAGATGGPVAGPAPSGWNLRDGGTLADAPVSTPQAQPDGAPVGGTGTAAQLAGPGNYAGFQPVSLTLPSGRTSSIAPAGVRTDGTLAVPDDPARVGWWTGGALPGERYGGVVLAGHVDSKEYGIGVLAEMLHIQPGAELTVAGARAGETETYVVTTVKQVPKARLAAGTGAFDQDVPQRLVLVTCGGPFDQQAHHYRDNVVVIAEPSP